MKTLTEELAPLGIANAEDELRKEQSRLAIGDNETDTGESPNSNSKENAQMAATTNRIGEQETTDRRFDSA